VEKREEKGGEPGHILAVFLARVAPAKPREIPQRHAISGNKKPALRAGSCLRIGGGVCLLREPISFNGEEIRADPCIAGKIIGDVGPPTAASRMPDGYEFDPQSRNRIGRLRLHASRTATTLVRRQASSGLPGATT
jgi:hypothetical protein